VSEKITCNSQANLPQSFYFASKMENKLQFASKIFQANFIRLAITAGNGDKISMQLPFYFSP
jgi:hypothetical protein